MIRNWITEHIYLRLSDYLTGQSVTKYLNFLLHSQWWSSTEIENFQNERLRKLVKHVYDSVPYYRELFKQNKLLPNDIKTKDDLTKIPILKKSIIKRNGIKSFTSVAVPKKRIIQMSSSGSTGEPLYYSTTKQAYSLNIAANLRGWYWMGYRLGDKYIKLSQNPRKNPIKRIQDSLSNNLYLATNPLREDNFLYILDKIEEYKPKIIRCYPDPLLFLAKARKNFGTFKYRPHAITTTGNTLFPEVRSEIESAFGCKVFDSYSSEGNSNIFECPSHTCYHSTEEYGITEVLDDEDYPIKSGVGRLISTDLWNLSHPFIRYDTQDYVEIENKPCICGRNHLKTKRIIGRDNDILEMPSGRKFIVHNFTGFFQSDLEEINRSVEQFQIVKRKEKVIFRLVVNKKFNETVRLFIKSYWSNEFKFDVDIEVLKAIPLTISGKRRFIIDETNVSDS